MHLNIQIESFKVYFTFIYSDLQRAYLFMFSFMISFHNAITPRRNSVSIYLYCVKSKQTDIIGKTSIVRRCYEIKYEI